MFDDGSLHVTADAESVAELLPVLQVPEKTRFNRSVT